MTINTINNHALTVDGKTTTMIKKGNYTESINGNLVINANTNVTLMNGNSQIKITSGDITIQSNKLTFGK